MASKASAGPTSLPSGGEATLQPHTPAPGMTLTLNEVGACNRAAQLDGTLYGTAAGSLGGLFSFRFLKQNKNASLLSGIVTGVIAGYVVSKQALATRIARAEADKRETQASSDRSRQVGLATDLDRYEGSATPGLETMTDKYATTSGDH